MKKRAEFDLDAECNFKALPPRLSQKEVKTLCLYEYMRESQALRDNVNKEARPSITPYLHPLNLYVLRLSHLCCRHAKRTSGKDDCPREYELQPVQGTMPIQYRLYCSRCDKVVKLPRKQWVQKFNEDLVQVWNEAKRVSEQGEAARSAENAKQGKKRAKMLPSLTRLGWFRLTLALRKAGFPAPWKELNDDARNELIRAIGEWDEERRKSYPPVVIEEAVPERDLQRERQRRENGVVHEKEFRQGDLLDLSNLRPTVWRFTPSEPELLRSGQQSGRKYFYGFIRIDESYNVTDAKKAFTARLLERYGKTKRGGGPHWQAKLNSLVVMRLWKQFPARKGAVSRVEHVAKFTTRGLKGCKEWWENRCRSKKDKLGLVDDRMSKAANEEMSKARADALTFFQSLFRDEMPLNY